VKYRVAEVESPIAKEKRRSPCCWGKKKREKKKKKKKEREKKEEEKKRENPGLVVRGSADSFFNPLTRCHTFKVVKEMLVILNSASIAGQQQHPRIP